MYCKLRNDDVVRHFVYRLEDARNHGRTLTYEDKKLFSYSTCIAQWVGGNIVLNDTQYSATTSRIMRYVRQHIAHRYDSSEYGTVRSADVIKAITGVPQNTQDLISYLSKE